MGKDTLQMLARQKGGVKFYVTWLRSQILKAPVVFLHMAVAHTAFYLEYLFHFSPPIFRFFSPSAHNLKHQPLREAFPDLTCSSRKATRVW